jgi:hypothetical protein
MVNATGGKSLMASLTTMKFAAQMTITPRTAASAVRRSVDSLTPAGRAGVEVAGVESGSIRRRLSQTASRSSSSNSSSSSSVSFSQTNSPASTASGMTISAARVMPRRRPRS